MNDTIKTIKDEIEEQIGTSLIHNFVGKKLSIEEIKDIKSQALNRMDDILQGYKKDGLLNSFQVNLIEESPEIQLIREVMEEPKEDDSIEFDIRVQTVHKIDYIMISINLEKGL